MSALRERLEANVPEPMRSMPRWLLWKQQQHPTKSNKMRKVPHYADRRMRNGSLDTPGDVARLVTMVEALDAYEAAQGYEGLGFAVVRGDGIVAFDLDGCLDPSGTLINDHAGADLAINAEVAGCYLERSPSGRGLRGIGMCDNPAAYSRDGVEAWGQSRFVTITGDVFANEGSWVRVDDLRAALEPADTCPEDAPKHGDDDEGPIITPKTIAELREALQYISAEPHGDWVKVGLALATLPNEKGRAIWTEWSATCAEKFDAAECERIWKTFKPKATNHKVVFKMAKANGWNPGRPKKVEVDHDDAFRIDLGAKELRPTEYIIDGFIQTGLSVVAGAWGAGKSLNLLPLVASAAHLAPESWGFWPVIRRKVVWVTEAPEQARDVLYSLSEAEGSASWDDIREWFILCRAQRREPARLAKMLKGLVGDLGYTLPNGFVVNPVVVLDTSAANIELENESDNSMVSAAMAVLKQELPGISIIVIGHTPKALTRADAQEVSFRGAGAWEADAAATYALVHDIPTDTRYLAIRKCRFSPTYREIEFDHEGGSKIIDTPWGQPQSKFYLHGVPTKSSGEARVAARQEAIEERREEALARRDREVMEAIARIIDNTPGHPSRNAIVDQAGGMRANILASIKRLVEVGALVEHKIDRVHFGPDWSGPAPAILLPAELPVETYLAAKSGDQNQLA